GELSILIIYPYSGISRKGGRLGAFGLGQGAVVLDLFGILGRLQGLDPFAPIPRRTVENDDALRIDGRPCRRVSPFEKSHRGASILATSARNRDTDCVKQT